MIEQYFKKPETWDRIRACWLFKPIERYVAWLHRNAYAATNIHRRVPILMRFAAYARSRGAKTWEDLPRQVRPFAKRWLRSRKSNFTDKRTPRQVEKEFRQPIEQMLQLVLPKFATSVRPQAQYPFAAKVPGFVGHLLKERGLSRSTVQLYAITLRRLEQYLERVDCTAIRDLTPVLLTAFVTKCGENLRKNSMVAVCAAVRVFLRYIYREKLIPRDLSGHVQRPRYYRLSTIPRSIPWTEVQRMLESVDRRSALGKRDYAILLLLVTYGLRSREVAALTLDNIDWQHEILRVPARKAGHSSAFPLAPAVGAAIIDYLKNARPETTSRHVFLTVLAPFRACGHPCVSLAAARYLRKAQIAVPRPGSHTLRHTCVQRLVDAKFPLKTIGDYIGHAVPDSTMIYTKIDVEALREMAVHGEEIL